MSKKEGKQSKSSSPEDLLILTSHEMGTPLSIAIFQLENMYSQCIKCGTDFGTDLFIAKQSLYQLQTVIENILHMGKYGKETFQAVPCVVDLCMLLKEFAVESKILAKEKKIQFFLEIEIEKASVSLDASLFRHALRNLIQNALKFTESGGTVRIILKKKKKECVLQIIDTGIGIPDEQKDFIFQKYFTGQNSKCHGIGLGLYLVKNIVDEHQWKLGVKDTPGGGSTFEIRIPLME